MEMLIGAHTSTAGGLHNALLEGEQIGATTVQIFTSNQRQWKGREITQEIQDQWFQTLEETGLTDIMSHASYLINMGSPKEEVLEKSCAAFQEEIKRCVALDIRYLNFHPGASLKQGDEECLDRIAESLLQVESLLENGNTRLLLEMTAGQGSNLGWRFEHMNHIIKKVEKKIPIGVCIDTCHIFAGGYDLRTEEACDATLKEFDKVVGLKNLYAFHLNDSLKGLGLHVDRHRPLGEGEIGINCFQFLMTDPRTRELPKYLETPGGPEQWKKEIVQLKEFAACV